MFIYIYIYMLCIYVFHIFLINKIKEFEGNINIQIKYIDNCKNFFEKSFYFNLLARYL